MFQPRRVAGARLASPPAGRGAGSNCFFGSVVDEPDFGGRLALLWATEDIAASMNALGITL